MSMTITPSIELRSFNCPHCGVLTTQNWHSLTIFGIEEDKPPVRMRGPVDNYKFFWEGLNDEESLDLKKYVTDMISGQPFFDEDEKMKYGRPLHNLNISKCYNCGKLSIWLFDEIIWPKFRSDLQPNLDLPDDIQKDFREAASIVDLSPRGSAALLRLAIQKLCAFLGEGGRNINNDIKSLVSKGLDVRVQQALDIVRVIGNNAVHPGSIDLQDDRSTALQLFKLVNLIADKMISEPKHVSEMFDSLPDAARKAIEQRDAAQGDA